jgi:uncharacterized damage-inducible protein DinB
MGENVTARPHPWPEIPSDLLLAHLEYAAWAAERTFRMVDRLPAATLSQPVTSSFPSILETLQHIYQWDSYYLTHLRGGSVQLDAVIPPGTYPELKEEWRQVHREVHQWATAHLEDRKHVLLTGWSTWPTWMVVMQVANHATHHLGQVLTLLRQAGCTPAQEDWTDLILFYLERYPVADTSV